MEIRVDATEVSVAMELCVDVPGGSVPAEPLQAVNNEMMRIHTRNLRIIFLTPIICRIS